jgi:hypothetical protein
MTLEMQIEMKLAARLVAFPLAHPISLQDKQLTVWVNSPHMANHQTTTLSYANKISENASERKHKTPRSRRDLHNKRHRTNGPSDGWNTLDDIEGGVEYRLEEEHRASIRDSAKIDLSPCHICHRKPTERKHLDDYADCQSCGRRTCYVCIRQCEGLGLKRERERHYGGQEVFGGDENYERLAFSWHGDEMCIESGRREGSFPEANGRLFTEDSWERPRGSEHRGKVCSRCCVEKGSEGEVWCLGCLKAQEGD